MPLLTDLVAQKAISLDAPDIQVYGHWLACIITDYKTGYQQCQVWDSTKIEQVMLHLGRVLLNAPAGLEVDHRDRNSLNYTRNNLRLATRQQNAANQRTRAKSGYRGVVESYGLFKATITINNRSKYLGSFVTAEQAAREYDKAALATFGEFAVLNFVS